MTSGKWIDNESLEKVEKIEVQYVKTSKKFENVEKYRNWSKKVEVKY
jgi:hypothetical protein